MHGSVEEHPWPVPFAQATIRSSTVYFWQALVCRDAARKFVLSCSIPYVACGLFSALEDDLAWKLITKRKAIETRSTIIATPIISTCAFLRGLHLIMYSPRFFLV